MSPRSRKNRIPRSERSIRCDKLGHCVNNEGEPIFRCNDASDYRDYAMPPSEIICSRVVEETKLDNIDPYKKDFIEISREIDALIAANYLSPKHLGERFRSIQARLEKIIDIRSSTDSEGLAHLRTIKHTDILERGRLPYHISARMLYASLGCFYHRALRSEQPLPREIMDVTHLGYIGILQDFKPGGLYSPHPSIVAHKRTECESMTVLSRLKDPRLFPYPALHREEASQNAHANHDFALYPNGRTKIRVSVKNSDYRNGRDQSMSEFYRDDTTVLVIYQDVVGLDASEDQQIAFHMTPSSATTHIDDSPFKYEEFEKHDPDVPPVDRYIRWGAGNASEAPSEQHEAFTFIQQISGTNGNGLMDALIAEAYGDKLSIDKRNLLNGASHFLVATIRHKLTK